MLPDYNDISEFEKVNYTNVRYVFEIVNSTNDSKNICYIGVTPGSEVQYIPQELSTF